MKIIAHTPVGKFEHDLGKSQSETSISALKTMLKQVTEGKYDYFKMGDKYLGKNVLIDSVFEILP